MKEAGGKLYSTNGGEKLYIFCAAVFLLLAVLAGLYLLPRGGKKVCAAENYIANEQDLDKLRKNPSGSFVFISDIHLSGADFVPIGNETNPFTGKIDGRGHTVSGFAIDAEYNYSGFFGLIAGEAGIENLFVITSAQGIVGSAPKSRCGVFAGAALGDVYIRNCYSAGKVVSYGGQSGAAGGFLGEAGSGAEISGCYSAGTEVKAFAGKSFAGGFIGLTGESLITDCYSSVRYIYADSYSGGFLGGGSDFYEIKRSFALGYAESGVSSGGFTGSGAGVFSDIRYNKDLNAAFSGNFLYNEDPSFGLNAEQFKHSGNFFGFAGLWGIYEGCGAPYLLDIRNDARISISNASKEYDGLPPVKNELEKACLSEGIASDEFEVRILEESCIPAGEYHLGVNIFNPFKYQLSINIDGGIFTVQKAPNIKIVLTADRIGYAGVELNEVDGALYSIDGGLSWQKERLFIGLRENTEYCFLAKIEETENYFESLSNKLTVKTTIKTVSDGSSEDGGSLVRGGNDIGNNTTDQPDNSGAGNGSQAGGPAEGDGKFFKVLWITVGIAAAMIITAFALYWIFIRKLKIIKKGASV